MPHGNTRVVSKTNLKTPKQINYEKYSRRIRDISRHTSRTTTIPKPKTSASSPPALIRRLMCSARQKTRRRGCLHRRGTGSDSSNAGAIGGEVSMTLSAKYSSITARKKATTSSSPIWRIGSKITVSNILPINIRRIQLSTKHSRPSCSV